MAANKTRGEATIQSIRQLIRYDIPILILGVSSIGKSYTINSLARKLRIANWMLFIGSEKPENIEGLPKLGSTGGKLEYFKPYWFPNIEQINESVANGRTLLLEYLTKFYSGKNFTYSYNNLNSLLEGFSSHEWEQTEKSKSVVLNDYAKSSPEKVVSLNEKPFPLERALQTREEMEKGLYYRDDIRDICSYICTIMGYGNFWLILDEVDKVEETDIDKYAPLLHIVRERYLKGWHLIELNDTKGINIPQLAKGGNYEACKQIVDNAIDNKQSLLDTRVIAIANATDGIENALFRRFVQIIVEDILILEQNKITADMSTLKNCLDKTGVTGGALETPPMQQLEDVNLQWIFNFLIRMINKNDVQGNYLYTDAISAIGEVKEPKGSDSYKAEVQIALRTTALYKILRDNFQEESTRADILICLTQIMFSGAVNIATASKEDEIQDRARKHIAEVLAEGGTGIDIKDFLEEAYPKPSTAKDAATIQVGAVKSWIATAQAYVHVSVFGKDGSEDIQTISQYLVPAVQHTIMKMITNDKLLPSADKARLFQYISEWWEKNERVAMKLTGDPAVVKTVLNQGDDPVYPSLMKKIADQDKNGLASYLQTKPAGEILQDEGLKAYIGDNFKTYIQATIASLTKSGNTAHAKAAEKIKNIFG